MATCERPGFQALAWLLCLIFAHLSASTMAFPRSSLSSSLKVGFYGSTCPSAEAVGCDASVLLDSTPGNLSEKEQSSQQPKLKRLPTRDGALKVGGINYTVPGGRRDGRVSRKDEVAESLPPPHFNAEQLELRFARKGLSLDEMVTLSGAHSIGITKCHPQRNGGQNPTVPLEAKTPGRLDNKYYKELEKHRGLLNSDQTLMSSQSTAWMVRNNARHGSTWAAKFAAAMVHMGSIDVLTETQGFKSFPPLMRFCTVLPRNTLH
ncbi:Peroxidase 5 [Vitis vinifera]|uniref:peroxidase n=1 Tax=Vitis vinifera TaxID=29760 RepID=A0A438E1U6_VITVI|nr:Peroxidase 5 [Vitis vinifera]